MPTSIDNQTVIRYSLKPIEEYTRQPLQGVLVGPALSSMLRSPVAWNLAYLSFDFESAPMHKDPEFTTRVRRTAQFRLDGYGPDLTADGPREGLVSSLLTLPAPRFLYLIERHPVLTKLPLYVAYGQQWVETMREMSHRCRADESPPDNVVDFSQARKLLERFR